MRFLNDHFLKKFSHKPAHTLKPGLLNQVGAELDFEAFGDIVF